MRLRKTLRLLEERNMQTKWTQMTLLYMHGRSRKSKRKSKILRELNGGRISAAVRDVVAEAGIERPII